MKTKIICRKDLCADAMFDAIHSAFDKIKDYRENKPIIPLSDALMSGFAMFSLKEPSLLSFDKKISADPNLLSIYNVTNAPSDTGLRKILDDVNPEDLRPVFKNVFNKFQRGKGLENMAFLDGYYLISADGTGYFSSNEVHCDNCMEKKSRDGKIEYYHQVYGASLVHPDCKEVLPLCPEIIMKQDGKTKNDCERNAAKRFLKKYRQDHPNLKTIIIEDSLSSNTPHIKDLRKYNCSYILGVKKGDHKFLFNYIESKKEDVSEFNKEELVLRVGSKNQPLAEIKIRHKFRFINQVPLNESNQDVLINFIEYWEEKFDNKTQKYKTQHFSWVTDIEIATNNVHQLMRGGRARWKIENETFNTLKNQGYNFEHNFGHGSKNLSTVFAHLLMLAFLVDQIQAMACGLFKAALEKVGKKSYLWEKIRGLFFHYDFHSMEHLLKVILYGQKREYAVSLENTS